MIYQKSCGAVIYTERGGKRFYLVELMQKGHCSICKGHVEGDESEHQTAEREIYEETGLSVEFVNGFRETIEYSPYENGLPKHQIIMPRFNKKRIRKV